MERANSYVRSLPSYALEKIDRRKREMEERGVDVIDMGFGDPSTSIKTPEEAHQKAVEEVKKGYERGYPDYTGKEEFRQAVSKWFERRFSVELDAERELTTTSGAKYAVNFAALTFLDRGDKVLMPDPGYPAYWTGTKIRDGEPVVYELNEENEFFYDFDEIDEKIGLENIEMMWLNSPHNPTTHILREQQLREAVEIARDYNILLVSDEVYSEIYFDRKPSSVLEIEGAREVSLVINSLSKRSSMTNYRVGFVAGSEQLLDSFKEVQTNFGYGPTHVSQAAGKAAYQHEEHVKDMRDAYKERREIFLSALDETGFRDTYSEGSFHIWAKVPRKLDAEETSAKLLEDHGIAVIPGKALSNAKKDEKKNGEGFVRFALIQDTERIREAAERIKGFEN